MESCDDTRLLSKCRQNESLKNRPHLWHSAIFAFISFSRFSDCRVAWRALFAVKMSKNPENCNETLYILGVSFCDRETLLFYTMYVDTHPRLCIGRSMYVQEHFNTRIVRSEANQLCVIWILWWMDGLHSRFPNNAVASIISIYHIHACVLTYKYAFPPSRPCV